MKHFLTNRKQRIVLTGQFSSWTNVKEGDFQGSILGHSNTRLFADVCQASSEKPLGLTLDISLTFHEHWKNMTDKISKTIGLLQKLQNILPKPALFTIYKCFMRPHLDYDDIVYDLVYNLSFHQKLESIQYNANLALAGRQIEAAQGKSYITS